MFFTPTSWVSFPAYYVGLMLLVTWLVDGVADVLDVAGDRDNTHPLALPPLEALIGAALPLACCISGLLCRISAPPANCCTPLSPTCVSAAPLHREYSVLRHAAVLTSDSQVERTRCRRCAFCWLPWRHHRRRGYAAAGRHAVGKRQPAAGIPLYRGDFWRTGGLFPLVSCRRRKDHLLPGSAPLKRARISVCAPIVRGGLASNIF